MRFFKKPLELHCYTNRAYVYNYAPVQNTSKITTKRGKHGCPGHNNNLKAGVTIPLWCDLNLKVGTREDPWWEYQFSDKMSELGAHTFEQLGQSKEDENNLALKIMSPWAFTCDEDIPFLFVGEQMQLLKYNVLEIMQGIIDFKYQASTNVNFIVHLKDKPVELDLPFLLPILKLIPFTEKKIKVVNHLVSDELFNNLGNSHVNTSFKASYYRNKSALGKKLFKFTPEA